MRRRGTQAHGASRHRGAARVTVSTRSARTRKPLRAVKSNSVAKVRTAPKVNGNVNGAVKLHGAAKLNGHAKKNGALLLNGSAKKQGALSLNGAAKKNGVHPLNSTGKKNGVHLLNGAAKTHGAHALNGSIPLNGAAPKNGAHFVNGAAPLNGAARLNGAPALNGAGRTYGPFAEPPPDEYALIERAKTGCCKATEALLHRYRGIVESKARAYFLIGADHEDIIQEGNIGLFKAIRDFRCERMLPFRAFAELCVSRQIFTAIKAATRQKHTPLNTSVSLYSSVYDPDSDRTLLDTIPEEHTPNPEGAVIQQQFLDGLQASMNGGLSGLECSVLKNHLWGKSYQETATELGRGVKSIDNALQRAKRKIGKDLRKSMILGP